MTILKDRLKRLISSTGPISVAEYMATCLFDPEAGYYTTREPFGASGDFTTAPEVSQMFGELIAVWVYAAWQALGKPVPVTLAEIGPGRGTLMVDMLRTLDRLDPSFIALARIALIEASPLLVEVQRERLAKGGRAKPRWVNSVEELDQTALIIIGNELFDAIPTRQFVKTPQGWLERVVTLDDAGELVFAAGSAGIDPTLLPPDASAAPEGMIFEVAPARSAVMDSIAHHIASNGGAGLFFDYGHLQPGLGDTLQAVRRHAFDDVLAHPGEADLTSHVDFSVLSAVAKVHGLEAVSGTQGKFLLGMGLLERAGRIGSGASPQVQERISGEVERLAGPQEMGNLFKVLAVSSPGVKLPPFSGAD